MVIYTPPFKSAISYSVQNEDYQTELAIFQHIKRDSLNVLMIASSGENVLSVISQPRVKHLHAIDLNPAQLRLCELRLAAAEHLTRDEQLALLGADWETAWQETRDKRLELYDKLRPHLAEITRQFWDQRRDQEIAFGIQHVGRNDVGMQDIRTALQQAGFAPLARPLRHDDLPRWKQVYADVMTPDYIQALFGLPSRALADRIAQIAEYLGECHFHALNQPLSDRNPFVTTVFQGMYAKAAGEDGLPLYLQEQGQNQLHQLGTLGRLHFHTDNLLDLMPRLASDHGLFDLVSISNIADWMTETDFSAVVNLVRNCLNSGGVLLARTATPNRMIESVMTQHLRVIPQLNSELQAIERGPWFRVISAGFKD